MASCQSRWAEYAGEQLAAGVGQWHAGHARHQPGQLLAASAGLFDCLAGNVQGVAIGGGQGLGNLAGVVALAAANIQPALGRVAGGQFGQALGQWRVMAAIEKAPAGFNHGQVVAWLAAVLVLHRQQVQVALAGAIETVIGRAGHAVIDGAQGRRAERTNQAHARSFTRVW